MTRIALNGRFSGVRQKTGTQVVSHELFDHLLRAPRSFEFVLFADPSYEAASAWGRLEGVEIVPVPFRAWGRIRSQLYEQIAMSAQARRRGAALLHHPMTSCPRFGAGLPQLVTLHDLNFHHHPEWYAPSFRQWLEHTAVPGLRKADRVVCISQYVADDAARSLGLRSDRLRVVPNGLKALARPGEFVRDPQGPPTVLAVNPWQPHKNLVRLIDAVEALRASFPDCRLRVAGRPHENFRDQPDLQIRLQREFVDVLGYLDDRDLAREYATASVLCLPSIEEGFGLPVIEAMHLGTPVVTSDRSCLPEIAGDAAILVDPFSTDAIARGLATILGENQDAAASRRERGFRQAARFRWEEVAERYLAIYAELLEG